MPDAYYYLPGATAGLRVVDVLRYWQTAHGPKVHALVSVPAPFALDAEALVDVMDHPSAFEVRP